MDLTYSAQDLAFQDEVRDFLKTSLPAALAKRVHRGEHLSQAEMASWHQTLQARGWLAGHWPQAWGGPGWSVVQRSIFETECALAGAPRIVPFGVNMLGPVLLRFGTETQKRYWLPRILSGEDWWCQGYSEPGAGSDLASLQMRAVRDGDHYIVNGQKTWTTLGHYANMIFCLVRTDPTAKQQAGISFLLIDLRSPGIQMRPIITLDGAHEVNEVFFTDVRVPVSNLVGEEHQGWTCAKYLLTYERTNLAGVGFSMAALMRLKTLIQDLKAAGQDLADDPSLMARVARVEIELDAMKTTQLRVLATVAQGGAPGVESSMLKIRGTEIRQEISALTRRALGPYALVRDASALAEDDSLQAWSQAGDVAAHYFNLRKLSIFGGSNEIQRNIIAKTLGL